MLLLLMATLVVAPTEARMAYATPEIVVVGRRIEDAKARLDSCLARNCPADEDIDATLALAEGQIIAGKYREARTTLLQSLGRNKDQAKRYPIPVSDLYRANGRVAAHLGFDGDYYRSTWGIYRALKKGLPSAEYRHFSAQMEIAEMMGRTRGHDRARLYYEKIAGDARKAGRQDIAAIAELRSALRHLPPSMGRPVVRKIANSKDPSMRAAALEAKLALARTAYEENDLEAAQAIQTEFATFDIERPILIYSPPYEILEQEKLNDSMFGVQMNAPGPGGRAVTKNLPYGRWSTTGRLSPSFDDMWIDVGFRITRAGEVADVKVLRSRGDIFWTDPLLASIRARRYTPGADNDPNSVRLERYTYTSRYEGTTGSRLADRSPQGRIEYLDLSAGGISVPN